MLAEEFEQDGIEQMGRLLYGDGRSPLLNLTLIKESRQSVGGSSLDDFDVQ